MSGGAYDYFFWKINEFCELLENKDNPRRSALVDLLGVIAKALKVVEWTDSGDSSEAEANEAIDRIFTHLNADAKIVIKAAQYDLLFKQLKKYLD